jgi:type VI secretion system protein ImpG
VSRVRSLRKPTESIRPGLGRGVYWRLISHLSLNHLSLTDNEHGLEALRALLRLYNPAESKVTQDQIEGITGVSSRHITGRVAGSKTIMTCRGLEISVEFDESHFVGAGMYLFASVLERFFALYASINSFTQLVARTRQPEAILKRWQPRAGNRTLL